MTARGLARLARTVSALHPLQILSRPLRLPLDRIARFPASSPPDLRDHFAPSPPPLADLARSEKARAAERCARLPAGSLLRAYEEASGLDVGDGGGEITARPSWATPIGARAYPSSLRARRLAVAIRLGAKGGGPELARACRAALAQVELHLLGNHLLENGLALACGGAVARGPEADLWWRAGAAILGWQLPEQFLADGAHFEGSASYHLALLAGLLECIELADASGRGAPPLWRATARRASAWMSAIIAPDGTYPLFNDAALDAAPPAAFVERLARSCGINLEEPAEDGGERVPFVRSLADSGWVVLGAPGGGWAVFDAGRDGASYQPAHVHADPLTFELWVAGRRAVVDYGVSSYAPGEARQETRSTRVHNTVEIAGLDACEVWATFRVGRRARARLVDHGCDADTAWAEATHDGYRWLPGRPVHRRRIELGSGRLEVRDTIAGAADHAVSRLRIDAAMFESIAISASSGEITRSPGLWYPLHGRAREAIVVEQRASSSNCEIYWRIEW